MIAEALNEELIGAEQPVDSDRRLNYCLADLAGKFRCQVTQIDPVSVMTFVACPTMILWIVMMPKPLDNPFIYFRF